MVVRDAMGADVEVLAAMQPTRAMHVDRVREADGVKFRYLVAEMNRRVVGCGLLWFRPESTWHHHEWFPQVYDLFVDPDVRGHGAGTAMLAAMERITAARDYPALYVSVEPQRNPRAHALYRRLGYVGLQEQPYEDHYRFVDSAGGVHEGTEWLVTMRKGLGGTEDRG